MKKIFIAIAVLTMFGGVAQAQTQTGVSKAGQTSVNEVVTSSGANANNEGVIGAIYNTPADTTAKITYGGSQTITQNQTVNGKQEQVVSGGTNSTVHQTYGSQTIKNTPSVSGPPLTASNDTCMGSASGSANGPGFGISLGKTYTDANCVMLKNAREMWNMGMKAAAMARMCMDEDNRKALEMTGFTCPQSDQRRTVVAERQAALNAGEPVDPIVRERMGLPKIKE